MKKKQFGAMFLLPIVTVQSQSLKQAQGEERMRKQLLELNNLMDACKTSSVPIPDTVIKQVNILTSRLSGAELDKANSSADFQEASRAAAKAAVKASGYLKGGILTFEFDPSSGLSRIMKVGFIQSDVPTTSTTSVGSPVAGETAE